MTAAEQIVALQADIDALLLEARRNRDRVVAARADVSHPDRRDIEALSRHALELEAEAARRKQLLDVLSAV